MQTEADAKMKWCPFARSMKAIEADQVGSNRHVEDQFNRQGNLKTYAQAGCLCLASDCMSWRWADPAPEIQIFAAAETDADYVKRRDFILGKRRGYCGLSGIPLGV